GGGTMILARSHMSQWDSDFDQMCSMGCTQDMIDWGLHDRAKIENAIGIGLVAVGGAAVVTGIIAVFRNQPREVEAAADGAVVVTATATSAAIAWHASF